MSRRITQTDLAAEIRSLLEGVRTPEPASLGQVLHRLPERAAAPRRWSLAISAALAAVLIVAVAIVGLRFIGSRLGPPAPAAKSGSVAVPARSVEAPSATGVPSV